MFIALIDNMLPILFLFCFILKGKTKEVKPEFYDLSFGNALMKCRSLEYQTWEPEKMKLVSRKVRN
jgi:hypothetical protein